MADTKFSQFTVVSVYAVNDSLVGLFSGDNGSVTLANFFANINVPVAIEDSSGQQLTITDDTSGTALIECVTNIDGTYGVFGCRSATPGPGSGFFQYGGGAISFRIEVNGGGLGQLDCLNITWGSTPSTLSTDGSVNVLGPDGVYYVNSIQVIGNQQPAVANATNAVDVITQLNALLARLRTHGLIAT